MHALIKGLAVGALGAIASLGALSVNAQSDGSDYHPMRMNSAAKPEVAAEAIAASHASGTESIGQSTSAPMVNSQGVSREAVRREAVAASHGTSTEAIGESTGMAGITGGLPH